MKYRLVICSLGFLLLSLIDSCKPVEPYSSVISGDSLILMKESLNFYSEEFGVQLDKNLVEKQIKKVEQMMNDQELEKIHRVDQIPDTIFQLMRSIQEKYIRYLYSDYPEGVLQQMAERMMFYREEMGDANEPFNKTCSVSEDLPYKQLQYAIRGDNCYLLCYEHGRGILGTHTHLALIDLSGQQNTITFGPEYLNDSDFFKPLGFRHVEYFRGEVYDGDEEDIF